jgi:hypothetical protein
MLTKEADELAENLLIQWAAWKVGAGQARGWGGVHEHDRIGSVRSIGEHSNPVEAEAIRDQFGEREAVLIDDLLRDHEHNQRRALLYRFCGVPRMEGPRIVWSGFATLEVIAPALGISVSTAHRRIAKGKSDLLLQLNIARRVRAGAAKGC